jgi:P27 family predicted phage terminase small subunit
MKGAKPKPTNLKIIEGNPGKRPLPKNEPKPKPTTPGCPRFLTTAAKWEWKRVAPELARLGLLTIVDRTALAAYCQSWADYKEAIKWMKENGKTYSVNAGGGRQYRSYPQVKIADAALKQIRAFCTEFGLTPSARARMQTLQTIDDDEMENLLSRKRL